MKQIKLFTIGYEGNDLEAFLTRLQLAGVHHVLDIRIRPQSRKPGFSKTSLESACSTRRISYSHDKRLGTPESIMKKLKETGIYDWEEYSKHLLADDSPLDEAVELASHGGVCLLCYEASAEDCHRRIVAEEMGNRANFEVVHL